MGTICIRIPLDYVGPRIEVLEREIPEGEGYATFQTTSGTVGWEIFPTLRELAEWAAEELGEEKNADDWFEHLRGYVGE